jgi:hypothetical protein
LLTPIHENRIMIDKNKNNIEIDDESWILTGAMDDQQQEGIIFMEWGLGFDVKEEIFRTNPPIIQNVRKWVQRLIHPCFQRQLKKHSR